MLSKVKVNEVKEAPAIGKPEMMSGIRTKDEAERWASRNGYTQVFWFKKYERVYADKTSRQPLAISDQPLVLGEQGSSCLEFIFLLAVVVFVLVVVLKDVPW